LQEDDVPNGDLYRATIEGKFNAEPVMIGLGFVSQSELPNFASDSENLAIAVATVLGLTAPGGAYMSPLSVGYRVDGIRVQDLNPGTSAGAFYTFAAEGGNAVDDGMPSNDALCVTWRDGLKGKQHRGRSYLTGFAEDSQSGSYWISEIQSWATTGFAGILMAAFGPGSEGSYVLSLVHTVSGGARLIPPTSDPIISFTVHNEVRTLRRRGAGVRISRHRSAP
jgi:hypothetical protein